MFDKFLIGSWVTYFDYKIMSYEEQTKRMAELGFNYNPFPFAWYVPESHDDLDDWLEIDKINQKYGLLYGLEITHNKSGIGDDVFEKTIEISKHLSDNLAVVQIKDEPHYDELDELAYWIKKYKEANPKVAPIFNLLPSYTSVRNFNNSYYGFLQNVVKTIGKKNICFLGNDYYPFDEGDHTKTRIYCDLEDIRKVAYKNGKLATHAFMQSCQWKGMRMPTIEEISWQAYSYLAYGIKAISYFNLVCPNNWEHYENCLIMLDGTIKDPTLLENVGKLNFEIRAVGDELIHINTKHAYHTKKIRDIIEILPKNYFIQPLNKEQEVIITSHDKKNLFMIMNSDLDYSGQSKFEVKTKKNILVFDPSTKEYKQADFKDGILTVNLAKGKGFLFKLI